jgi:outer membrane protein
MTKLGYYRIASTLFAAACIMMPGAAMAQVKQPLWEAGIIGGVVSTPAYPGSRDRSSRALASPLFIYRGKIFRSDESGIGARLVRSEAVQFDIGFAASLPAKSDDVTARAGMPNLGTLVEFGPRVKVTLARPGEESKIRLDLPLRRVLEVRSGVRGQGWAFEPKIVYEMRDPGKRWNFDAHVGLVVGDRKINGYLYDVAPQYATAARPAYEARSGLMLVRAGASASRKINPDLRLFGFVRLDSYSQSANADSPLMLDKKSGVSAGVGMAWTFARSDLTE